MHKRYQGEFLSINAILWRVEIWQEATAAFATVGDLDFPDADPLLIEYSSTDKTDVMCSSTAALTIISPADRTYLDLYTVKPGTIRMDVYRENAIYWSGCLDPEHASEPFNAEKDYNVTLYFSDFGILKRLPYNLSGQRSMLSILQDALSRSVINFSSINQNYISTYNGNTKVSLNTFAVLIDNFYDEERKPMMLWDVVEGMMQPLALRLIQKAGTIWIYDLNGIFSSGQSRQIQWSDQDQMIGVDKLYNNVSVSFSPYADGDIFPEFDFEGVADVELVNLSSNPISGQDGEYYSYYPTYEPTWSEQSYTNISFTIFLSDTSSGLERKFANAKYFKTVPVLGGSEDEGVALWFYTGGHGDLASGLPKRKCAQSFPGRDVEVFATKKVYLPAMSAEEASKYYIRIQQPVLADARYNPYVEAGRYNESGNQEDLSEAVYATLPVDIQLYDASGQVTHHYTNKAERQSTASGTKTIRGTLGTWASGASAFDDAAFMYHNIQDGEAKAMFGGWMTNRQSMNFLLQKPAASMDAADDGQYIPYPAQGGFLELSVKAGLRMLMNNLVEVLVSSQPVRWMLFGAPDIALVRSNLKLSEPDTDDVVYEGVVNPYAEESLEISTICGTMENPSPLAKGLMYYASDGSHVSDLTRAGRTARPEELLIGTAFSHHAERKDALSGTAIMDGSGLGTLSEAAISGKKFLVLAEEQNLKMDETNINAVEIVGDIYTADNE